MIFVLAPGSHRSILAKRSYAAEEATLEVELDESHNHMFVNICMIRGIEKEE